MSKTMYLHSLGCKVNAYETASLATELEKDGYTRTDDIASASVIILNTCSVTGRADQKSRQHISSFRAKNPGATILVMGCYSQKHAEKCAELGGDIVLGSANRSKAAEYIKSFQNNGKKIVDVKSSVRHEKYEELGSTAFCENARAYLKIQDGCDNFCSYCFIPQLRGNSRSREPRDVVEEASALVAKGYKEIVITGIHIGAYGKDLGDGSYRLSSLLKSILNKCPELYRLRISSIEESEIDDDFLRLLANYPAIVDHLHIPLQSGSASILASMKRHYDTDAFLAKLSSIRAIRPDIAITTDVIAGYPGETDEQWEETKEFCRKADFAEIHVFPFSPRPGTYAASLKDTDPRIKKARVHELLEISKAHRSAYEKRFYGQELEVLFEEYSEADHLAYGHTSNYLLVKVPANAPMHGCVRKIIYDDKTASD